MDRSTAAERVALGLVDAERKRRRNVVGAEVLEIDGLVLALSNLPDRSLNAVVVEREPFDPTDALHRAREACAARGHRLGIELQRDRHPALDRAVHARGLRRVLDRPGMVVELSGFPDAPVPDGVVIRAVGRTVDAEAFAGVDVAAFGGDPMVSRAFYGPGSRDVPGARSFVAWERDEPIGIGAAYLHERAIGVFGVGVVPQARRRGVGAALTTVAARAFPEADIAWLHPSETARSLYASLGFRKISRWEVWEEP